MAEEPSPEADPVSSEFHSAHIESLRQAMETLDVNDEQAKVEAEIEASKVHWSELTNSYFTALEGPAMDSLSSTSQSESESMNEVEARREHNLKVAEDNVLVFRSLQDHYPGGFFLCEDDLGPDRIQQLPKWMIDENGCPQPWEFRLSSEEPFSKGRQAQLFHADLVNVVDGSAIKKGFAMKVFKEETSLREFKLLPRSVLSEDLTLTHGISGAGENCNVIACAQLLKSSGRFAFLMHRAWGDLRKLIDIRMLHFNNQGPLFSNDVAVYMLHIARGMHNLHAKDIMHRDLKAANLLVFGCKGEDVLQCIDPIHWKPLDFECIVANYECSGFMWMGFWRAPEILSALKDRNLYHKPKLFYKETDVYSFGMTCYEIISGGIPFEGLCLFDTNIVIGGSRPILPSQTTPWMKDLVCRCWHKDPSMRPTFEDIIQVILFNVESN